MIVPPGAYPTMITPFFDNLEVNYPAIAPLMHWYETHGAAGVFALCASSEIDHLSLDERLQLLREILRVRSPGMAVIASGQVSADLKTLIREAQAVAAEGPDALIFIASRIAAQDEDEDEFLRKLELAAKALGDLPLGLYECPSPYKRLLPPDTIRKLPNIGNFVFLKDTSCDAAQIAAKVEAAKGTSMQIFNANTATLLASLQAGGAGFSGVMGNFHPQIYAELCRCFAENPARARQLQDFLGAASMAQYQQYPVNAKYYLGLEGVPLGYACRCRDAQNFTSAAQLEIQQLRGLTSSFSEEKEAKRL